MDNFNIFFTKRCTEAYLSDTVFTIEFVRKILFEWDNQINCTIDTYGDSKGTIKTKTFYLGGKIHNVKGRPAIETYYESGKLESIAYYQNGKLFREKPESEPIIVKFDETGTIISKFFIPTQTHKIFRQDFMCDTNITYKFNYVKDDMIYAKKYYDYNKKKLNYFDNIYGKSFYEDNWKKTLCLS